jgi:hypothetical protein
LSVIPAGRLNLGRGGYGKQSAEESDSTTRRRRCYGSRETDHADSVPLRGLPGQCFSYGVWSTLSKQNFELYAETFDSGEQGGLGPWFGWFSNRLKGYPDTLNMKCQVHPQFGRRRPWIELEQSGHPLAIEARDGIAYERLLEIHAMEGHTPLVAVPSSSETRAED